MSTPFSRALPHTLWTHGHTLLESCVGPVGAAGLRREIGELQAAGLLHLNATHVIQRGGVASFVDKPHIFEGEGEMLVRSSSWGLTPERFHHTQLIIMCSCFDCTAQLSHLSDTDLPHLHALNTAVERAWLPELVRQWPELGVVRHAIKVQCNTGTGGCFPLHVDSDLQYSSRILSSVLYLNPTWQPADGGELVLYPFPFERVVVPPISDRLVMFSSPGMLHRVLPSHVPDRTCLTIWVSQTMPHRVAQPAVPHAPPPRPSASANEDTVLAYLLHPFHRPHVARLFHSAEWTASLLESHAPSDARARLITAHEHDIRRLRQYFEAFLPLLVPGVLFPFAPTGARADWWRRHLGQCEPPIWFPRPSTS